MLYFSLKGSVRERASETERVEKERERERGKKRDLSRAGSISNDSNGWGCTRLKPEARPSFRPPIFDPRECRAQTFQPFSFAFSSASERRLAHTCSGWDSNQNPYGDVSVTDCRNTTLHFCSSETLSLWSLRTAPGDSNAE